MPEPKKTDLPSRNLDIVVLGARTQEFNALSAELAKGEKTEETSELRRRMRDCGALLKVFALSDAVTSTRSISVGLLECADMGNVTAAINTAQAIVEHEPTLLIFSGIAGSMNASKFRIGDVILPRRVRTRYFQKLKVYTGDHMRAGDLERAEILTSVNGQLSCFDQTIPVSPSAQSLLTHVDPKVLQSRLQNIDLPEEWQARHGVLRRPVEVVSEEYSFSWDKVLSNQAYIAAVRSALGNAATVVDMESYGFLSTVQKLRGASARNLSSKEYTSHGVVVRSVSDYAEHKELSDSDPQWRELALRNMAITTRYLIQNVFGQVF